MRAFYYENNTTQKIGPDRPGHILIGNLDLEPGEYAVWAKLLVGVNASSGYPGPAYPFSGGAATLVYGDGTDQAIVGVKPESGENNETVNLMTVGKSDRARRARLYFINPGYPLPVFINLVRLTAIQVEIANQQIIGEDHTQAPEDVGDMWRAAIFSSRIRDTERLMPQDDD